MKHNCRSLLGFDQSTYFLESLCHLQKIRKKYYQEDQTGRKKDRFQTTTRMLDEKRRSSHGLQVSQISNGRRNFTTKVQIGQVTTQNTQRQDFKTQICKTMRKAEIK
jgi:hypothetical protein